MSAVEAKLTKLLERTERVAERSGIPLVPGEPVEVTLTVAELRHLVETLEFIRERQS